MTKNLASAAKKASGFSAEIKKLETCIELDSARLEKAYPKALSSVEKELKSLNKELQKIKALNKPAKKGKGNKAIPKAKPQKPIDTSALVKRIADLKAEKAMLQTGYKKCVAGKKMWQQVEKSLGKQSKKTKRSKKAVQKKSSLDISQSAS